MSRQLASERRASPNQDLIGAKIQKNYVCVKPFIDIVKFIFPFVLGIGILWWMYRGTDWGASLRMLAGMHRGWMLVSLAFGVVPLLLRAWRWRLALSPLGERPPSRICIDAIFVSYAASLVIPRIGEVTRCGTLKNYASTSFSKALGTVVSERIVDSVLLVLLTVGVVLFQLPQYLHFLHSTGSDPLRFFDRFTSTGYIVSFICGAVLLFFLVFLLGRVSFFRRGREKMRSFMEGLGSLRRVRRKWLYFLYSIGIWAAYFLHFYLAFFAFDSTATVDFAAGLLAFCVGSFAVLVPTPNGAGPWHFAVKTILVLYGVSEAPAVLFVLLVHTIQTALVVFMGAWGWADLLLIKKQSKISTL